MRIGKVYNNQILAGTITELDDKRFTFLYEKDYVDDVTMPAICIHLPKRETVFTSSTLFAFFYNLISEGANKKIQSIRLKIDEDDAFGFLLKTAAHETIGAISVEEHYDNNTTNT